MKALVVLLLALVLSAAACGSDGQQVSIEDETSISVVATTPVLADFARNVGSGVAEAETLLPAGVDPHDYEPTPADIEKIRRADVVVRNGVGFEEWFDRLITGSDTQARVVDASEGVTLRREGGEADPHIWHSPVNAKIMVSNISRALQAVDPEQATAYQANERAYGAQIDGVSRDIRRLVSSLNDKRLVTNHDSIGYYADEFGFELLTTIVPTFDSQAEVSPAQVQQLIDRLKTLQVKAIFVEANVSSDVAKTVAEGADIEIVEGERAIYGDTLGEEGSPAATYLEMMRHNTNVIVNNLNG